MLINDNIELCFLFVIIGANTATTSINDNYNKWTVVGEIND